MLELNKLYNIKQEIGMKQLTDSSIDCILTDPPYLYLKNQKLEQEFDEPLFFSECKRVLKKDGFIILFGRGTSFYRWNTILDGIGFSFKEEIIWDKSQSSSPLMNLSRVHETISIHSNGGKGINKVKVPYVEMKAHNIDSIILDINRLKTVFKNTKALDAVLDYLENNKLTEEGVKEKSTTVSSELYASDRVAAHFKAICEGMNEKSIIRTDLNKVLISRHQTTHNNTQKDAQKEVTIVNSMHSGMNEKSIIKQGRDHYTSIHPTQKPVRLLERLLALTTKPGDLVLDPFAGSCSTGEACLNTGRNFIAFEMDAEYFEAALKRINTEKSQLKLFA